MAKGTIWVGAVLVLLGIFSYIGSGAVSVTALIPTFFGVVLGALGAAGQREDRRPVMMHLAVGLAVLGLLGSAPGLLSLPDLLSGSELDRPWAVGAQSVMAVVLAVYVGFAIRSFLAARRARAA